MLLTDYHNVEPMTSLQHLNGLFILTYTPNLQEQSIMSLNLHYHDPSPHSPVIFGQHAPLANTKPYQ